ncbi:MAG: mechanosensitive ion channel family protein, partial [Clostridia bacterium]|nr:mechanosensitive ion channel family protein [Clostridia bacterium]
MMKELILNAADDVAEAISETVSEMAEEVSASGASGASTWDVVKGYIVEYGLRLLIALVVLFVGLKLINVLVKRIKKRKALKNMDNSAATMLGSFLGIALKVILFVTVIGILGIPMTSVITIIGTVSLAIGLALQGSLANFAGGLMIIIFKPFKLGDFIDNHTDSGVVTDMGVFYTTLTTPDNRVITVPNSLLSNA